MVCVREDSSAVVDVSLVVDEEKAAVEASRRRRGSEVTPWRP